GNVEARRGGRLAVLSGCARWHGPGQAVGDPSSGGAMRLPLLVGGEATDPGMGHSRLGFPWRLISRVRMPPNHGGALSLGPSHRDGGTAPGRRQTTKCGPGGPEKESTGHG